MRCCVGERLSSAKSPSHSGSLCLRRRWVKLCQIHENSLCSQQKSKDWENMEAYNSVYWVLMVSAYCPSCQTTRGHEASGRSTKEATSAGPDLCFSGCARFESLQNQRPGRFLNCDKSLRKRFKFQKKMALSMFLKLPIPPTLRTQRDSLRGLLRKKC